MYIRYVMLVWIYPLTAKNVRTKHAPEPYLNPYEYHIVLMSQRPKKDQSVWIASVFRTQVLKRKSSCVFLSCVTSLSTSWEDFCLTSLTNYRQDAVGQLCRGPIPRDLKHRMLSTHAHRSNDTHRDFHGELSSKNIPSCFTYKLVGILFMCGTRI